MGDGAAGRSGVPWTRRRGISPAYSETLAPWMRMRQQLEYRYRLGLTLERRWERPDEDDDRNVAVFLRQASASVDADLRRLAAAHPYRLSPTEVDALRRIATKPSAVIQLAEYLRLDPSRASRVVTRLEDAGLVTTAAPWSDLRKRRAEATPEGEGVAEQLDAGLDDLARLWLDELDDDTRPAAVRLLAALADLP